MCDKKEKQLELDKRYLRMAAVWAENSYCKRRQVGALIVKDQMIISSSNSSKGATIYVTSAPCIECAKLIIQSGIKRVVYSEKYRVEDGCNLLRRAGVIIDYIEIND